MKKIAISLVFFSALLAASTSFADNNSAPVVVTNNLDHHNITLNIGTASQGQDVVHQTLASSNDPQVPTQPSTFSTTVTYGNYISIYNFQYGNYRCCLKITESSYGQYLQPGQNISFVIHGPAQNPVCDLTVGSLPTVTVSECENDH